MNNHFVHTILPPNGELNEHSFFKPAGYHQLIIEVVECEMCRLGNGIDDCLSRGYAWALGSMTVEVPAPITDCSPLFGRTWLSTPLRVYTRREVELAKSDGTVAVRATLFSVPLDIQTHSIIRDMSCIVEPGYLTGPELIPDAQPRMSEPKEMDAFGTRTVQPSDIDALGHMNNCRYGAAVYDTLDKSGRGIIEKPFRYRIDFRRQLPPDTEYQLFRTECDGVRYVRGIIAETGRVSFAASAEAL